MDPIAFAIPAFLVLIVVELAWARHTGRGEVYRFSDSISDLSCGVMQQVLKIFIVTFTAAAYIGVHGRLAIFELSASSPWVWVATFFGVDFFYYWFHRMSHQVNFLWAAHVVHHQSEEYNLTVALRQSALQPGLSWIFYLPLALIGVPPFVFFVHLSVNTLYQFWIHTRLIDRLGPLEWVLNTPSHHRVHHGQNPQYIDKNHAGTLIIWDRLFGTFEPEGEEVVYGVTEPSESWNPLWVNLHTWWLTARRAWATERFVDKVRLFTKGPGWLPPDLQGQKAPRDWPPPKYDPAAPPAVVRYVFGHFVLVLGAVPVFLLLKAADQPVAKIALGAAILAALMSLNGLLEGRRWALRFEQVRLPLTGLGLAATWLPAWPDLRIFVGAWLLLTALSWFALAKTQPGESREGSPAIPA